MLKTAQVKRLIKNLKINQPMSLRLLHDQLTPNKNDGFPIMINERQQARILNALSLGRGVNIAFNKQQMEMMGPTSGSGIFSSLIESLIPAVSDLIVKGVSGVVKLIKGKNIQALSSNVNIPMSSTAGILSKLQAQEIQKIFKPDSRDIKFKGAALFPAARGLKSTSYGGALSLKLTGNSIMLNNEEIEAVSKLIDKMRLDNSEAHIAGLDEKN